MLKKGDFVQNFELPDQTGTPQNLNSLLQQGPVVLFFYPRAMTFGCTAEACRFRDEYTDFQEAGATVWGISDDPVDRQSKFAGKHQLGYSLLSDPDQAVHRQFGVVGASAGKQRATFVIGQDQRIHFVFSSNLFFWRHAKKALEAVKELKSASIKK